MNILGGVTPNDSMMMTNTMRNGGTNIVHKNNPSGLDILNTGGQSSMAKTSNQFGLQPRNFDSKNRHLRNDFK